MSIARCIASRKTEHGVPHGVTWRALDVSQSWFYQWRDRPPAPQRRLRAQLTDAIRVVSETYGSPRIGLELRAAGCQVSDNTTPAIMVKAIGRHGKSNVDAVWPRPASGRWHRIWCGASSPRPPDVLWCGDVTEVPADEGQLRLASVADRFSRRLLGYATNAHHDTELTCAALRIAAALR
ncbi:DDE-type integrase/transposase/recombinase [Nocardia sp. NPDC049220]|uniref:DDE-type integrase/transposase/recombinase n=1 Tax=Nocardia sp. NPDC049220 TaxID=3155273 RepID=UPI0033C9CFBC